MTSFQQSELGFNRYDRYLLILTYHPKRSANSATNANKCVLYGDVWLFLLMFYLSTYLLTQLNEYFADLWESIRQ